MFAKQSRQTQAYNGANRNTFISKTTVNSIIAIISKLMKEELEEIELGKPCQLFK